MRGPSTAARGMAALVGLGFLLTACSEGGTEDGEVSSIAPDRPSLATVPPTTVSYTPPTSLRPLTVDPTILDVLLPLSPTELLSIDRSVRNDGRATPTLWAIDVMTGGASEIEPLPANVRNYTGSDSWTLTETAVYFAAATCPGDPRGGCAMPWVDLWRFDVASRVWNRIGAWEPSELIGKPWDGEQIQIASLRLDNGQVHLEIGDDCDCEENVGRHLIVVDPSTGEFERRDPEPYEANYESATRNSPGEPSGEDAVPCDTPSGAEARVGAGQVLHLRAREDAEWTTYAELSPTYHLICGTDSVWAVVGERWTELGVDGAERASQPLVGLDDPTVAEQVLQTSGAGTMQPSLVIQLGVDTVADLTLSADRWRVLVFPSADRPPLIHEARRATTPPDQVGPVMQAVTLPGGRIVVVAPMLDGYLLVAE